MGGFKQSLRHFIPTQPQILYCLIAAGLITLYWCRVQLEQFYLSHTGVSGVEVQQSLSQFLTSVSDNRLTGYLPLATFWVAAGLIAAAVIYESVNLLIAGWNDYLILSRYTNADRYRHYLIKRFVIGLVLFIAFILFVALTLGWLLGVWQGLIAQPADSFFALHNIWNELIGLAGLTINLYVCWMFTLYLVPQFF